MTRPPAARVLAVDDRRENLLALQAILEGLDVEIVSVTSGEDALKRLLVDDYAVILLDAQMPDMDGFALAGWVRQQAALMRVPLIMLTSGAMRGDALRCRELGIDAYFPKPVSESELHQALATILGGAKAAPSPPEDGVPPLLTRHELRQQTATLNVLLVEDNLINQKVAMHLLTKLGHRVTLANNGQEALDCLQEGSFDVALMDMQMPVMGGVEATQHIRQRERERGLPRLRIVAMTANAQEADRKTCLAAGMDDYLSKPFKGAELAEKLLVPPPRQG